MICFSGSATEPVELVPDLRTQFVVVDTETFLRCEAQDAELALVHVVVHLESGLSGLVEREGLAQHRMDHALGDHAVGLVGLAVVGEVAADDLLEVHPEVAVVVLDVEARGRRARDDHAAALGDEHRRAHGGPTGVLEHDVDVTADELTDLLAEAQPLLRVLGVLIGPEPVALGAPVDDRLFFAGEACSTHDYSTAHGAYRTGIAAAEQVIKSQTDSLSSSSQMDMVRLQSLNNKRSEAFDTMTNMLKKASDSKSSVVSNFR